MSVTVTDGYENTRTYVDGESYAVDYEGNLTIQDKAGDEFAYIANGRFSAVHKGNRTITDV